MTREEAALKLNTMGNRVSDDLIRFGQALEDADLLTDGWAYVLAKPYKWDTEYMEWEHRDKPSQGDGETWDEFVEAVE